MLSRHAIDRFTETSLRVTSKARKDKPLSIKETTMSRADKSEERNFDYGKVAEEYDKHRKQFPESFFEQLKKRGLIAPGKTVLDLGAGTGLIANRIAQLEPDCLITAADCAQNMLEAGVKRDKEMGITNISYCCTPAEDIALPENSFDLIIAGRCWHWFDQEKTIQEIKRISKPNATFIITHYDPELKPENALDVTTKVIQKYDPTWKLPIERKFDREYEYLNQLMRESFTDVELQVFIDQKFVSQREWVDFFKTTSGVSGNSNLTSEQIDKLNIDHEKTLADKFGSDKLDVKYNLSMMFSKVPKKESPEKPVRVVSNNP